MRKYLHFISRLYNKKIDAAGLSVFRITYTFILLCEVLQLYYFRHLIFDKIPFIQPAEINLGPALIAWMVTIVFLMLGLFSRQAALINYLFSLVFIATIKTYEYHMFYLYMGINFLLLFINVSQVNSLDRLRIKLKYSNTRFNFSPPRNVSVLNYYLPVLVGIAFVYFDSIFFKFDSSLWKHGLGFWLPASVPQVAYLDYSWILNMKAIVIFLGYLTLVFEIVFLFLFGVRKCWILLFLIGVGFHLGILLIFPIPWFALGVISIYLLLVPASLWLKIYGKFQFKKKQIDLYYDEDCPLCNRTKIIISHFDIFNAVEFKGVQTYGAKNKKLSHLSPEELLNNIYSITKKGNVLKGINTYRNTFLRIPCLFLAGVLLYLPGIYHLSKWIYSKIAANRFIERCTEENCGYTVPLLPQGSDNIRLFTRLSAGSLKIFLISLGIFFLCILQIISTYRSPLISDLTERTGFNKTSFGIFLTSLSWQSQKFSKTYFGITGHSVFLDSHFEGYNHIIAIEYIGKDKNEWLPIIEKDGRPGNYLLGPTWAKWSFRVNSPLVNPVNLKNGIRDFSAFWLKKSGHPTSDAHFIIWVKKIETPHHWSADFLEIQRRKPWIEAGIATWVNEEIFFDIKDIEKI
ncbi:DCC1-like thiol-disulfide oxidoreductase family protein [Agriterribacter humi]|uniref:DCC1-like thiol-disulfide oxidoreductase family protein n=1 Tax=Agriterribacter humi TaxID=1104781 RepID=UPI00126569F8|nr:DCC1-like thiol-disulfide oxidoreductase family protein [Agriterribacter humi]